MFILASNDPKIDISTHQNHKIPIPEIMGILLGYRVIPEGGFLRVSGIRYLPVPEPKYSGIRYGCELGYTRSYVIELAFGRVPLSISYLLLYQMIKFHPRG